MADIDTKEVAVVKQQATKALNRANEVTIASDEDLGAATDILSAIKGAAKAVKDRKEAITKPLNEALASARNLFRPMEDDLATAEKVIKGKMLTYQDEQEKKRIAATAAITDRVERGTMKAGTAIRKIDELPAATTSMQGKTGSIKTSIVKKYRVVDEKLLPREFLMPNMPAITEALKAGKEVPGAEIYEEKVISAR